MNLLEGEVSMYSVLTSELTLKHNENQKSKLFP